jgi:hypothetical protein
VDEDFFEPPVFFEVLFFEDEDFFDEDEDFFDDDEDFFDEEDEDFFDDDFFDGTLPPSRRASESPMAMACLRLVTFLPEPPLFNFPRFISCMFSSTFSDAFFPYLLAMQNPPAQQVVQAASPAFHFTNTDDGASTIAPRRFTRSESSCVPAASDAGTRSSSS